MPSRRDQEPVYCDGRPVPSPTSMASKSAGVATATWTGKPWAFTF